MKKKKAKQTKGKCWDCDGIDLVDRREWFRVSNPRCSRCGGMLERQDDPAVGSNAPEYGPEWTKELKQAVRRRDGQCCLLCGKTNRREARREGHGLSVHHIDRDKSNSTMHNLATVCKACHNERVHGPAREQFGHTLLEILRGSNKRHALLEISLGPVSKKQRAHIRRMKRKRKRKAKKS